MTAETLDRAYDYHWFPALVSGGGWVRVEDREQVRLEHERADRHVGVIHYTLYRRLRKS